ncbi:hypothetical protein ABPG72_020095 [Tetrahymena utriculariae]
MQKLEQFKKQVNKNTREVMQIKRKEEKEKENELLKKLELEGGINNEKTRDQYMSIKFMNFYISQKIQYMDFTKKNNKQKNENDFMKSMQNVIIILRKNQKGNIIFTKVSFMQLHDLLNDQYEELPFHEKNKLIAEQYEELLEETDKLKDLTLNNEKFNIVRYGTLKGLSDMKTIQKELSINFY